MFIHKPKVVTCSLPEPSARPLLKQKKLDLIPLRR
jgi:hypothetical protein